MIDEKRSTDSVLAVTRVRHALKRRLGRVVRVVPITPELIRITLRGEEFSDFQSDSFDDHVKVFFPAAGEEMPVLPTLGPDGPIHDPTAPRAPMRDFTPRRFDRTKGELDLEFYLHDAGPATTWAARAQVGQYLAIGGPRGSMIIPTAFDWHLLIGDETALPAIARRLEELPRGVKAIVVAEVAGGFAQLDFKSRATMQVTWIHRGTVEGARTVSGLPAALAALPALPSGEGYAWAAAESVVVRELRNHLIDVRGLDKSRIRAAAYWKRGVQSIHEVIED
jgi:NADPH-dependent ferric siderophore reductase